MSIWNRTNGTVCNDGDTCTENDVCISGICVGTPIICDDGLFCNGNETCIGGTCLSTSPPNCDDGNLCTFDQCSFSLNQCINTLVPCIGDPCGITDVGICQFGNTSCNSTTGEFSCVGNIDPA